MAQLGDLEAAVMSVVWKRGAASVQHVVDALAPARRPAYTTVMTVMSRLTDKGLLRRRKDGRAYVYEATKPQEKVGGSLLNALVNGVYGGSTAHAIAHLIDSDETVSDAELARLEALIRGRRRERRP